jgi:tripartite-type tricarboxylate transporter receptor subunit TctC
MDSIKRRKAIVSVSALVLTTLSGVAMAQSYPTRPVKFVAANPPGGLTDTVSRILAPRLQTTLGQAIVIENKPGANGGVAASSLASSAADGYAFIVADGSMLTVNPLVSSKLSYDPKKDFVPVSLIGQAPLFLAVNPRLNVNTFDELIALARSKPGSLNYGSSGIGSTHHLTMEALKGSLKLDITHIPFKGSSASVPALVSGEVDMVFSAYPSIAGFAKSGQVKLLAVNSSKRWSQEPNVPAIAEKIPGFDFAPNIILIARTGTPAEAINRISTEIAQIAKQADAIDLMRTAGISLLGGSPQDLAAALQHEGEQMEATAKLANLKPE